MISVILNVFHILHNISPNELRLYIKEIEGILYFNDDILFQYKYIYISYVKFTQFRY